MVLHTESLRLVANGPAEIRAQIEGMEPEERAQVSPVWLERAYAATAPDPFTLGFTLVHRATESIVGACGFKGPPGPDGTVEIAYGVAAEHRGNGFATEAAKALVAFAFGNPDVRLVCAHTLEESSASTRVLAKCGFQPVGQVVDPEDGLVWRWEMRARVDEGPRVIREKWFDRSFDFTVPADQFASILDRLRLTPARLERCTRSMATDVLTRRPKNGWSIQQNVGHLLDLEPLWLRRAQQFFAGEAELAAADLTNRRTHEADHNARRIDDVLLDFRAARAVLMELLAEATSEIVTRTARHPRLGTPMRLIDHALFVAEHDDHHLATISELRGRPCPP